MKKALFIVFLVIGMNVNAQITLEHVYDSAATFNFCSGNNCQLMIINFEVSGERYVKVNRCGRLISIYDINHAFIKNISLANIPLNYPNNVGDILYLSENLFNNDSKIEFMYVFSFTDNLGNGVDATNIYNENGTLIFTDTSAAWIKPNYLQQQYPIYNTSHGTKMILSCRDGKAKVFSLPGTLSLGIAEANNNLISMQTQTIVSNAYPNPTNNRTQLDYILPDGVNDGEIVFYNLQGTEIKRFKVDRSFNTLLISTADIAAGTYLYQLQTNGQNSEGKKLIIIDK